jgi:hypothetical protein
MFTSSFFRPLPLERWRAFLFPAGAFSFDVTISCAGHAGQ